MTTYEKPKCECGGELVYVEIINDEVTFKINKNGRKSIRERNRTLSYVVTGIKLKCDECSMIYDFYEDEKGCIYRED